MENAYPLLQVLTDYEADLLAVGMSATLKGEFETACDKQCEAEIGQEYQKRLRIRSTTQRIRLFNATVRYLYQSAQSSRFDFLPATRGE